MQLRRINQMENNTQQIIIKTKAQIFEVVKSYYKDLDDLAARLQADYAAGEDYKPFEQQEQDRLALCFILDFFDDLKTQIKTIKKERKNYGK